MNADGPGAPGMAPVPASVPSLNHSAPSIEKYAPFPAATRFSGLPVLRTELPDGVPSDTTNVSPAPKKILVELATSRVTGCGGALKLITTFVSAAVRDQREMLPEPVTK